MIKFVRPTTVNDMDSFIVGFFAGAAYTGMLNEPDVSRLDREIGIKPGETVYDLAARLLDMDAAYGALCHICERCNCTPLYLSATQVLEAVVGRGYRNITSPNMFSTFLFNFETFGDDELYHLICGAKAGVYDWENVSTLSGPQWAAFDPIEERDKCHHAGVRFKDEHNPTVEELVGAIR